MRRTLIAPALLLGLSACDAQPPLDEAQVAAEQSAVVCVPPVVSVDPTRSLAITDLDILNPNFGFQQVMTQIWNSAAPALGSPQETYHLIFDTNNPGPGVLPFGQHCGPTVNGFNILCPKQEGVLADAATHNPFCVGPGCDPYVPLGLFNRFDLADATSCGEYRIVFGKRSLAAPPPGTNRNLIILEAKLPNPKPGCGPTGMNGCRPVTKFWADLTNEPNPVIRGNMLRNFYFNGLPGFKPIFDWANYSAPSGQIRSNQFMTTVAGEPWQLREYKLFQDCTAGPCRLSARMVTDKNNPDAVLFGNPAAHVKGGGFQNPASPGGFIAQVDPARLAAGSINGIAMSVDNFFNGGQSTAAIGGDADYTAIFNPASVFANDIQTKLTAIGSPLTPANIVARAKTQACAGCHQLSNGAALGGGLFWPASLGFVHVSDTTVVPCGTPGGCWQISPALTTAFLPARKTNLDNFVMNTWCDPICP